MIQAVAALASLAVGQVARRRPVVAPPASGVRGWLFDSRNAVLLVLLAALVFGGGRKLLQALKARKVLDGLNEAEPGEEVFREATRHGRAAVVDLFRLLGSAGSAATREAAGRALSVLWRSDELITEEEKAIVSRGFVATWHARRRYPRAMKTPIRISIDFGVPFLGTATGGVGPKDLAWSYRISGTDRVSLETDSPWQPGPMHAAFSIDPRDFRTDGPHRLALQARVRTAALTTAWELELPHIPFSFEFDPNLALDSLLTLPDEARAAEFARRVDLASEPHPGTSTFLFLNGEYAFRAPPILRIQPPLPCDLAHVLAIEMEGWTHPIEAGYVLLGGQGEGRPGAISPTTFPLAIGPHLPPEAIDGPGERRVRAILRPDPGLGWADPAIRSIWPETITTPWITTRIVRR